MSSLYDLNGNKIVESSSKSQKKMWITSAHRGLVSGTQLHENTLGAYYNAYINGADMIETDAYMASDGVLVCNHDPTVTVGGVTYAIGSTSSEVLTNLVLSNDSVYGEQKLPTLESALNLAYHTGMMVNIDMKNGGTYASEIAKLVLDCGMRGKVVYALNSGGVDAINAILEYDPDAMFMNIIGRYTDAMYSAVPDYEKRFFAYTSTFTEDAISAIREKRVMLACINLTNSNLASALKWHPEMCEYPHTSDFANIEQAYLQSTKLY